MKKHGFYVRVSTEAQAEEGFSIGAQKERLSGYAVAMGWEHTDFFVDGGYSGSHLERPALVELINQVKLGEIASVTVYKLDRLSRSQKDTLYLIEDVFLPNGVDFISLNESIDTSSPYGRAMIGIMSAFAQLERENIFMRTRMGMLERVKQGYWMGGGRVPFGYDYCQEQGILVPNPEESYVVSQVYEMYLAGESPGKIAEVLGLSYDRLVMQIINRRSNLGLISYKGEEYQGKHQAIVSEKVFELAQERRKGRQVGLRFSTVHLLSGLIFCGGCGGRMRYVKWGKKGYKLRCYGQDPSKTYMNGAVSCDRSAVWAEDVEKIVVEDVKKLSLELSGQENLFVDDVVQDKKRISQLRGKLKRLYHIYGNDGDVSLLLVIEETKKSIELLEKQEKQRLNQEERHQRLKGWTERVCSIGEVWNLCGLDEKQEILRDCISRIVVNGEEISVYYVFDLKNE